MIATFRSRRRVFENSATTALIAASMPPMPRPVTIRHTDRSARRASTCTPNSANSGVTRPPRYPVDVVTMTMPVAITTRQPSTVGRRPILSARLPRKIEPSAMPISSIDSTKPSAARLIFHSAAMPGDAKLIDSTSKPSSALRAMVIPTMSTCMVLIGDLAMMSRGSVMLAEIL